jgi:alpha-L-glutamate ligase-like protein
VISRLRALRKAGVLGLNGRNGHYIMQYNERRRYPLVDDKIRTKQALREHGIAVPELLGTVAHQYEAGHLRERLERLDQFVIKPAGGSRGDGIIVIGSRRNERWVSPGGSIYDIEELQFQVSGILNGLYSLGGQPDRAMFEALVHTDARLRRVAPEGVPDIRVIVFRGIPVMAMMRLPTRRSGGRANLHHGAIGAGIDMTAGRTLRAVMDDRLIDTHPDSGAGISDFEIPDWSALLKIAAECYDSVRLGYLGVDIVIDATHGPQVLELNARPGLSIQIANQTGLQTRLRAVDRLTEPENAPCDVRLGWMTELSAAGWP